MGQISSDGENSRTTVISGSLLARRLRGRMEMRKRTVTVAAVVVLTTLTLAGTAPAPLAGTGQLGSPESTQADSRASAQSAIELLQLQERARRVALCEGLESCIRQLRRPPRRR